MPNEKAPQRFYRPELDIVRLFAFLSVFISHSRRIDGDSYRNLRILADAGNFGLCLFFVLSAYLITTLLLREMRVTSTISIRSFYRRRILRIWPLYFLALTVAAIWSFHTGTISAEKHWFLAALVMAGNIVPWPGNLAGHLWSISIEEQFYLIWPSMVRFLRRDHLLFAALGMIVLSNITLVYLGIVHADPEVHIWGNTLVQFEMFAAGTLLALRAADQTLWPSSRWLRLILLSSVPVSWYVAIRYCRIKEQGITWVGPVALCIGYGLVALSSALLIYALLGTSRWPKWLVHMGKVSYGLYVFHIPVLYFVNSNSHLSGVPSLIRRALALILTSLLALLSYRYFETPFLKRKARLEIVPSRPVESD